MIILAVISLGKQNNTAVNNAEAYIISQLAKTNPEHQFILCLPQQGKDIYEATFNLKMVYYQESVIPFITKLRLEKIIQGIKPDVCICADDVVAITSETSVYRWITTQLTNKHSRFLKQPYTKWLLNENPDAIWQHQFTQHQISYTVINPLLTSTTLIADMEKFTFKQKYTSGSDFVLYNFMGIVDTEKWILLLKAYTQFKQWNKTGLQLLIGCSPEQEKQLLQILENYKLRNEVHVLNIENAHELEIAIHAAYMLVDLTDEVKLTASMLCALQCGVPLIVPEHSFFINVCQESVLYTKTEVASIASKMTLVYKDETACEERSAHYKMMSQGGVKMMEVIQAYG